jgi:GT2 family glycosyltransferase/glycosyltransferase involved in cell wall biosynthesis
VATAAGSSSREAANAAAAAAWRDGLLAARDGDLTTASRWLERAHRLAPDDPRIQLDLAYLRLRRRHPAAAGLFEAVARRYDHGAAWAGWMAAAHLAGDHAAARDACDSYLRRHCLDPALAGLIEQIAGANGWCGVTEAGAVLSVAPAGRKISARLDGAVIRAPKTLPAGGTSLVLAAAGTPLLGSPLDLTALRRVEGLVEAADGLRGWVSRPAAPERPPVLTLTDARGRRRPVPVSGATLPADDAAPLLPRHEFVVLAQGLAGLTAPFRLCGPDGGDIFGSPIDPAAIAAITPVPASKAGRLVTRMPKRAGLAVVVPVYRGLAVTQACLNALFAAVPARSHIIVVDDATPEPELAAWLDDLAAAGRVLLIRQTRNRGFPAAVNAGIAAAGGRDVLLLNSDTLVPPGAIETMRSVAYARPETGSVTPLSNEATICSYPRVTGGNPPPDLTETTRLNGLARAANGTGAVRIPTGIGFCMLLRHDCLAVTGLFREEIFAQGYGEENDWCLRARHLGYRHAAATGAFVAHLGGTSFRAAGRALNARNAVLLNRLHPGYDAVIGKFVRADPLAPARRRLDLARFAAGRDPAGAVLLVSHNHGGGVARRVAADMAAIRAAGQRPLLLFPSAPADPAATPFPWDPQLTDGETTDYPNLVFATPGGMSGLQRLLRAEGVRKVIFHHGLGHHPEIRGIAARLGVSQEIVIHDYASFCPRVNLVHRPEKAAEPRYCGEPNRAGCVACVRLNGDETHEGIGIDALLRRSAAAFAAAAKITAPSADTARRIARHFPGIAPRVTPWQDDTVPHQLRPPKRGFRKIVVIGGIGPAKGLRVLLECAADAQARGLALEFIVAGASAEDAELLDAGIHVTGAYAEGEVQKLLAEIDADLAFLPSIWPETWCFTLSEAWAAGLYAIAFDLGAQGARIRSTGRGALLPLGLPAPRINDSLLAWQADLRNSPVPNRTMA